MFNIRDFYAGAKKDIDIRNSLLKYHNDTQKIPAFLLKRFLNANRSFQQKIVKFTSIYDNRYYISKQKRIILYNDDYSKRPIHLNKECSNKPRDDGGEIIRQNKRPV